MIALDNHKVKEIYNMQYFFQKKYGLNLDKTGKINNTNALISKSPGGLPPI